MQNRSSQRRRYGSPQKGIEKGIEAGIRAMVDTLRELSLDREAIAQKLASKFSLPPEAAAAKVAEYWEQ